MTLKPYEIMVTFQVTEKLSIEATTPDEAVRKAIEAMDDRHKEARLVHAETGADA